MTLHVRRLPWWIAIPIAALGGWLFDLANPGVGAWPLIFPAVLLVLAAWWQQRIAIALVAGIAAGAGFWLPHISWLTLYLGPIPWLALSVLMIAWYGVQGAASALATRGLTRLSDGRTRPIVLALTQASAITGIWVLREGVQGSWPYGGFSWGRVAHVFASSPFGASVSWLGFAGLTAIVVFCCALMVSGAFSVKLPDAATDGARTGKLGHGLSLIASAVLMLGVVAFVPPAPLTETGTLRVAAVQGNSKSGIFDDRESGDVFAGHVKATEQLLDELEANHEQVDVIVWPENAAEFAITDQPLRGRAVALISQRAGAPIVMGTVLANDDGTYSNSSVVWGPRGQQQPETTSRYDKRFPVPFAEYMPNRNFFHALVPDLVDLVQLEYTPGTRPSVMELQTSDITVHAGAAICFDITFDNQAVQMVGEGAELILAQTNNADFGRTDESVQQLQIARLRAIETGRVVINISTVGTSAVVAPDGSDLAEIEPFTAGAMVATVPLVEGVTPALRFGASISATWMLLGAAGIIAGGVGMLLARKTSTLTKQPETFLK